MAAEDDRRTGRERLRVGLHHDGTPGLWVEGREVPFGPPQETE